MIRNEFNRNAYSEVFDMERLREIANDAKASKIPGAEYSDFECSVWSLMRELVRCDNGSCKP